MIITNPIISPNEFLKIFLHYYRNKERYCNSILQFCNSGRVALIEVLKELEIKEGEKILLPAYICDSIPETLKINNYEFIFVDTNEKLDFPNKKINKIISENNIKAVLLVDYFGLNRKSNITSAKIIKNFGCKVIIDRCHTIDLFHSSELEQCDAIIYSFRKILPILNGGAYWCKNSYEKKIKINNLEMGDLLFMFYQIIIYSLKKINFLKLFYFLNLKRSDKLKFEKKRLSINFLLYYFYFNQNRINEVALARQDNFRRIIKLCSKYNISSLYDNCEKDEVPQFFPIFKKNKVDIKKLLSHGIKAFYWPGEELPSEVRSSNIFPIANYLNNNLLMLPIHHKLSEAEFNIIERALMSEKLNE